MTKYQKKNILIGGLLAVVIIMAVAYAAFASNLTITGTGTMSGNWCIGFDSTRTSDYQATPGITGGTTPIGNMSFSGDACSTSFKTTASLNASFKQPGDKIEYTLTIGNKGSFAAAIESIKVDNTNVTSDTTITKGNIKYIIEMPLSTTLAVNATTTMKVTAMFQNDTPVGSSTEEQQTISIAINSVQDDGSGGSAGQNSQTVYAINTNTIHKNISTLQDIGTTYNSCSATGKNICLKYTIENDAVTKAEVCFIKGGTERCLQGWTDECLWDNSINNGSGGCTATSTPVLNSNKLVLQNAFTEENACEDLGSRFFCEVSNWLASAASGGEVDVNDDSWTCITLYDGSASCFESGGTES